MSTLANNISALGKGQIKIALAVAALLLLLFWASLPNPLFRDPLSLVLTDAGGELLGARIAADGQWRFPYNDQVNEKFTTALLAFEDKRFYRHPGFDPLALARALRQNLAQQRIVSGGSTLSMQVIRLARKGRKRSIKEKLIEIILALRLELSFSKRDILALYASNAPFGGNVVGLDAAAWRYFGKSANSLSWSQAATLAVLPNSPAMIHPGRNRSRLLQKRNELLGRLFRQQAFDQLTLELALEEALPEKPHPLPSMAPHLLDRAFRELDPQAPNYNPTVNTSLQWELQQRLLLLARHKSNEIKSNGVHNLAILVLDVPSGKAIAYVGNAPGTGLEHGEQVDIITARRSTGSLLKPLLYGLMIQEGQLLPQSLVPDIPTQIDGFRPENFQKTYDGAVPARTALARSLNVPFVHLLKQYGVDKFHAYLKKTGLSTLSRPSSHYGLSLILGGAEGTLWEMTNMYACAARTLLNFSSYGNAYDPGDVRPASYQNYKMDTTALHSRLQQQAPVLQADAIWLTLEAMDELQRPDEEGNWQSFSSSRRIAWKTGTSYGFRDAWAIGVTPRFAVGVWAGNADGEGRPGLTGIGIAAPLLFDVFSLLPSSGWFQPPQDVLRKTAICNKSGYLALEHCEQDTVWGGRLSSNVPPCPYHQLLSLDTSDGFRVSTQCHPPGEIQQTAWFVLPPALEYYYKSKHPDYQPLPPWKTDCEPAPERSDQVMQLIFPANHTKLFIPRELNGEMGKVVFKVAHRDSKSTLFWHLDNQYAGTTRFFHEMQFSPAAGLHSLTLVDEKGNRLVSKFEVLKGDR
jgi:penicillin-binding protein 1C